MSFLSRLLGLIFAVLPGLAFLTFSVSFVPLWPRLAPGIGPLYSLASLITGAVCLYLGAKILFGRETPEAPAVPASSAPPNAPTVTELRPMQAAPLPVAAVEPIAPDVTAATSQPVLLSKQDVRATVPLDSPETRIRQVAQTRPNWQVTAPQLAHLTNLNMAVADATAREMAESGHAQIQTGPNGETVYVFDLAQENR